MWIDVIDTDAGFEAVRSNWEEVFMADPTAEHFLSWTWLRSYLSHRKTWFVLALRERHPDAPYVAFFPLRVTALQDKKTGAFYNEIVMAGGFAADYTGFIAKPEYEHHAVAGFSSYLKKQNWTNLRLDYLHGPPERRENMVRALQGPLVMFRDSTPVNEDNLNHCICPHIPLPSNWETYLEQHMSSQTRQKLRRFMRKVESDDEYRITMATAETVEQDLDILFRLWRIKWVGRKGEERTDKLIEFTRQMLMDSWRDGTLEVPVLWHGDQPLGALANIIDRQKMAVLFYITGRDETWKTPSPGLVLHGFCIRRAIEAGFKTYDFLRGNEPYKYMFGITERRISCTLFRTRSGTNLGEVLHPRTVQYVYEQAQKFYQSGQKSHAEVALQQVLASSPEGHGGAEFGLATLAFERGNLAVAEAAFKDIAAKATKPIPALMKVGDAQLAQKHYRDAAETFRRIAEHIPHHSEAQFKHGMALAADKRLQEAERVFLALESQNSDDPTHAGYVAKARLALTRIGDMAAAPTDQKALLQKVTLLNQRKVAMRAAALKRARMH